MKVLFQFDASASGYEVRQQLSMISSWTGVAAAVLLERVSGDAPQFCLEVDVADQHAGDFQEKAKALQSQFSGYVYNLREVSYRVS